MSKRSSIKSASILVRQTEDGLHLANSILWFDSHLNGDLSFLSSASAQLMPRVPQVIATEETVRLLEAVRKKPNALVCQYNRPFSIGRLKIELLPSGCVLGGASLYVETDRGRLLYAPRLQNHPIATVRRMQLKKATTLILGTTHPDPMTPLPNRKREKERLLELLQAQLAAGQQPIVQCEPIGTAQELTKMCTDAGIAVAAHELIHKINRVYEASGSKLGEFSRIGRKHTKPRVVLMPLAPQRMPQLGGRQDTPVVRVVGALDGVEATAPLESHEHRFIVSQACDGPEIKEVVAAVAPKELYIFGPYAKRYVEELAGTCPVIKPLFVNDQPTLF